MIFLMKAYRVLCKVQTETLHIIKLFLKWGVTRFRRVVAGMSQRRPGFDLRAVHVRFVADKVALGKVFLQVFQCFPVSIVRYLSPSTCCFYRNERGKKPGNRSKSNVVL